MNTFRGGRFGRNALAGLLATAFAAVPLAGQTPSRSGPGIERAEGGAPSNVREPMTQYSDEDELLDNAPGSASPTDLSTSRATSPAEYPRPADQPETSPDAPVYNALVMCHASGRSCTACHYVSRGEVVGTRPLRFGAFNVRNTTGETLNYQLRWGESGRYKRCELSPGKVATHYVEYDAEGDKQSLQPYVRFDSDLTARAVEADLRLAIPLATPHYEFGNDFRFELDGEQIKLKVYHRGREK